MNIKAIIVDDEASARNMLHRLLIDHCPSVDIVGEATNVKEAVKLINKANVELVFLDVEMPDENGFALFDYFDTPNFETIFCTAYTQYAIQAFDVSAVDYILKPINIAKLQTGVEKAIKMHGQNTVVQRIAALRENLNMSQLQKIALPLADGLVFVKVTDILFLEADGSYTTVHTHQKKILVSKKIKFFEDILSSDTRFFRTHRSFIVNVENIQRYSKKDGTSVVFDDGNEIPVAREKVKEFETFIHHINL